jgi:CBS domain-containing protein
VAARPAPAPAVDLSVTAGAVMHPQPTAVAPETMLFGAVAVMADRGVRHIPVVDSTGKVVGMVTDRDIRSEVGDPRAALLHAPTAERLRDTPVSQVMSRPVWTVQKSAPLAAVAAALIDHHVGAVAVVDQAEKLVGMISYVDLIRRLL